MRFSSGICKMLRCKSAVQRPGAAMMAPRPPALDELENRYEAALWLAVHGGLEPQQHADTLALTEALRGQIQFYPETEEPKWR